MTDSILFLSVFIYIAVLIALISIGVAMGKRNQIGHTAFQQNMFAGKNTLQPGNPRFHSSGKGRESEPDFGPRYVVTEQPEKGYVILNGVKRKLRDCRNL